MTGDELKAHRAKLKAAFEKVPTIKRARSVISTFNNVGGISIRPMAETMTQILDRMADGASLLPIFACQGRKDRRQCSNLSEHWDLHETGKDGEALPIWDLVLAKCQRCGALWRLSLDMDDVSWSLVEAGTNDDPRIGKDGRADTNPDRYVVSQLPLTEGGQSGRTFDFTKKED